jgi:hypothetical protein
VIIGLGMNNIDLLNLDRTVLESLIRINATLIFNETTPDDIRKDRDLSLMAVHEDPWVIQYIDDEFRSDERIVMEAMKQDGSYIQCASSTLRGNKNFILSAIRVCSDLLYDLIPKQLISDPDIIQAIIDGPALPERKGRVLAAADAE